MAGTRHDEPLPTAPIRFLKAATWRGIRVLAWDGNVLYGSRGYEILRWQATQVERAQSAEWEMAAHFRPAWWRNLTSRATLTYRLVRDGFHALAILPTPNEDQLAGRMLIAAVPGAIVAGTPGSDDFRVTHQVHRGTRPLHITAVPDGTIYWGEYFDNRERAEVHIYASADSGGTWHVAHTFSAGTIRHVHNIVYDRWADCVWILTGDEGAECKILRASRDLRSIDEVLAGNQQARAVAAIPTPEALYLSTDTPFEQNHVLRMDRNGGVAPVADLASSSIYGCRVGGEAIFFSTMVEPSTVNRTREVHLVGSNDRTNWQVLARWQKDNLSMRYFQYGNALLPDGENTTKYLAATTIAVEQNDLVTTLWAVDAEAESREPRAERPLP